MRTRECEGKSSRRRARQGLQVHTSTGCGEPISLNDERMVVVYEIECEDFRTKSCGVQSQCPQAKRWVESQNSARNFVVGNIDSICIVIVLLARRDGAIRGDRHCSRNGVN